MKHYHINKHKFIYIFIIFLILTTNFNFKEYKIRFVKDKTTINNKIDNPNGFVSFEDTEIKSKINYYENFLNNIKIYNHTHSYSNNIYWCWFQGLSNAPKLYQATFNSVKNNCNNHNIIIINETNLNQYVKFPNYILEKYKRKLFSSTHFSDLLRLELLIKYGGTWVDASVLITKCDDIYFNRDLFFFNLSSWFLTSEKESPILKTTRDLLYEYWRKENYLCYYFLFHEFLMLAYKRYQNDYLSMPNLSNGPEHLLHSYLVKQYNDTIFSNIIKKIFVHKLNIKITSRIKPVNDSFFYYIIDKYLTI